MATSPSSIPSKLPHSEESERAVLAAVLLDPAQLAELTLKAGDFHLPQHQILWRAFVELDEEGSPIDLRTVQAWLEQRGLLEGAGGLAYLASLDVDLPDLGRVDSYAAIVRDRALRRQLLGTAQRLAHQATVGELAAEAVAEVARRDLDLVEVSRTSGRYGAAEGLLSAVLEDARERVAQRQATGRAVLGLASGIPRLDALLGGFQRGLYLLAGAPGVGKTTLALQTALHVSREVPVLYVTFENTAANLLTKALCVEAAISSADVARGFASTEALAEAGEKLRSQLRRLILIDGDGHWTVSQVAALARRTLEAQRQRRCLVVVDYLQLWAKTSRELRGLNEARTKVDALAGDLIDLARRLDSPVLALSSQSRTGGAYGRGGGENSLDSFKESGDLEYSADVALFLTAAKERTASPPAVAVDLTVRKNRHGPTGSVDLLFLPARGTLREVAAV